MAESTPAEPATLPLFKDMGAQVANMTNGDSSGETDQRLTEEIESLCMNCHANGTTRLLLTRIPFFREIVIMSFSCPDCGFQNNEIQSAGSIQERGVRSSLRVEREGDLQRQVVKSDTCVLRIEELDLEIPPGKGRYTNVEGVVASIKQDLEQHQEERMRQMPEVGEKVAAVIATLGEMSEGRRVPFVVTIDDPSGNSTIEPKPGEAAGKWTRTEYDRTPQQNAVLGLGDDVPAPSGHEAPAEQPIIRPEYRAQNMIPSMPASLDPSVLDVNNSSITDEVHSFPSTCPGCTRPCATNMKMVQIPHFDEVVLFSTVCGSCGYRSNEVKTGGAIPARGRRITLHVRDQTDLARDILKSESAALVCPEISLRLETGTMGGRFTTVEGILTQVRKDLRTQVFGTDDEDAPVGAGDSMTDETQQTWQDFFTGLSEAIEVKREFTLVLEDPLARSYVQSLTAPEPDPQIEVEEYERTAEEEEQLGLLDIKTEGYGDDEKEKGEEGSRAVEGAGSS